MAQVLFSLACSILLGCTGGKDSDGDSNSPVRDTARSPLDTGSPQLDSECVGESGEPDMAGRAVLSGVYLDDLTLQPPVLDRKGRWTGEGCSEYLLRGDVVIGSNSLEDGPRTMLTIVPGTRLVGEAATLGTLVINRGGSIDAQGTEDAPIVMSSQLEPSKRNPGDWGGLVINGRAEVNCDRSSFGLGDVCEVAGNGGIGGGSDDADGSGTLRYVRVEFAGQVLAPTVRVAGISLRGVGSGTEIEYVQVHQSAGDGLAILGGTANLRNVVVTGSGDDALSWTDGWRGKAQYVVLQAPAQGGVGEHGIVGRNSQDNEAFAPVSDPTLANVTVIGNPGQSKLGLLLDDGSRGTLWNTQIVGFGTAGFALGGATTSSNIDLGNPAQSEIQLRNVRLYNPAALDGEFAVDLDGSYISVEQLASWFESATFANRTGALSSPPANGDLDAAGNQMNPTMPRFASDLQATSGIAADEFFESDTLIGAVADADTDWTRGWTRYAPN